MPRLGLDRGQGRGRAPSGDAKKTAKGRSGGRTASEDRERAFVAASRRSDRSAEARLESANMASKVHFQRTGRYLKITPQIVENGEQYESDDDVSRRIRVNQALGPAAAAQSHINHTVNDADFLRREQQVNSQFAEIFGQFSRPPPPVPSHGGRRSMPYTPPCPDQIAAALQQQSPYPGLQGVKRRSAPSTAQPSPYGSPYAASCGAFGSPPPQSASAPSTSPYDLSYMAFGSPPPQAASQYPAIRSRSVATSSAYGGTPDLVDDSSATPNSGGSPFDYLATQMNGGTDQPAGPTYGVERMLADQALSEQMQDHSSSIQDYPLFPGPSCAQAPGMRRKRPSYMMEGQSPYTQGGRCLSGEQYAFSGTAFAPVTQSEQKGLEAMMDNQDMFSRATRLDQLDAQCADMSRQMSPHGIEFIDPFAEFTNGDGL